jgi:hypothetical protein
MEVWEGLIPSKGSEGRMSASNDGLYSELMVPSFLHVPGLLSLLHHHLWPPPDTQVIPQSPDASLNHMYNVCPIKWYSQVLRTRTCTWLEALILPTEVKLTQTVACRPFLLIAISAPFVHFFIIQNLLSVLALIGTWIPGSRTLQTAVESTHVSWWVCVHISAEYIPKEWNRWLWVIHTVNFSKYCQIVFPSVCKKAPF